MSPRRLAEARYRRSMNWVWLCCFSMPKPQPNEPTRGNRVDVILVTILVLQIAGLVYAGLAPFSFSPPNRVQHISEGDALQFDAAGIATSEGVLESATHFPDDKLTIHLIIEPDGEPGAGLGTILSLEDDQRVSPLVVAQWKTWVVIRVREPDRATRGYWEMDAAGFPAGETHFVTITSGPTHGTAMYVDGVATGDARTRSVIRNDRALDARLLVGCLGNGSAGWRGKLKGLAILGERLDASAVAAHHERVTKGDVAALQDVSGLIALYDFTDLEPDRPELLHSAANLVRGSALGKLEVPKVFSPLRPETFGIPQLRDMKADWFLQDLLRNIAGFIPLGFVLGLMLIRRRDAPGFVVAFQVAILGVLLSLTIESIQIALPMRSSSLSDLTLNVIGTMIGSVIALAFRHTRIAGPN